MNIVKKISHNLIIKIFFIIIFLNYLYFSIRLTLRENAWIAGDWLINYEAGLLRRGFSGELILLLTKLTSIKPTYLLILIQLLLFCIFLCLFYSILNKKRLNIFFLFILFSPVTISFTFHDPLTVGRKEIIFFLAYLIYLIYFLKDFKNSTKKNIVFYLSGLIFVLIHEIFLFFSTFFIFSKFYHLKICKIKVNITNLFKEILIIFGSICGVLLLILYSSNDPNTKELVCNRLLEAGLSSEICKGALTEIIFSKYLNSYKSFGLTNYILAYSYLKTYSLAILLFFFPLSCFMFFSKINKKELKIFFSFAIFQLLFLVSIFIVVNDWGRYLNIFFVFILIFVSFFFLKTKKLVLQNNIYKIILTLFLIAYSITWHMPHCCQKNLGSGLFNLKDRIIFRLNNPTNYDDKTRDFIKNFIHGPVN